ncbi:hypothetical protein CTI12_AA350500 [Artemisia annua]|uniref:Uncharacterized protein n=1 Tax=Artemisia annua TaxID=35608 RepID=A0A2U1MR73_ARTAN|nr:hypothetical protein CTI12_AA350500 [Artemisia annua]
MAQYVHGTPRVIGKYVKPYCGCGLAMTVKTAWTRENPGKRFIACPKYGIALGRASEGEERDSKE